MLTKKYYLLLSICFLSALCSCDHSAKPSSFVNQIKDTTNGVVICTLGENIAFLGRRIPDFAILSDTTFLVTSPPYLFKYNTNGDQIESLNTEGRSNSECISPDKLHVTENYIYTWCSALMKFVVYDHQGTFQSSHTGFDRAISKFDVINDKYICLYTKGDNGLDFIELYDIDNKQIVLKTGNFDQQDILLSFIAGSGGVSHIKDIIVYLTPSKLDIHKMDLSGNIYETSFFEDSDFKVDQCKNANLIIDQGIKDVIDYGSSNSVVTDIYVFDNNIYVLAEVGFFEYNNNQTNFRNRKLKVFKFTSEFEPTVACSYNYDNIIATKLYKDKLYILTSQINGESRIVKLIKHDLL